jgi:hypothetical protein
MEKLSRGRGPPASRSPSELGQTSGCLAPFQAALPDERETENFAMLRLGGAPMLGGAYAKAADDIVFQIANGQCRHWRALALANAAMKA